ncbi:MAG: PLP-dependent aspartate aminotransferase family protein [Actinomycetota bacterium]|jgi:cystathionine beta-lyase/cystathionine gamma-synthase|nr:PLP-dependent aspartate aminotransferase family protein [Actinomycetota bacterium]
MNERPRHTAATEAISAGRIANDRALSTPIWTSAVWEAPDADEAARQATSVRPERFYSRYGNPTVRAFEDAVAALERAEAALAFGSGMGALSTVLFALCSAGDHVVASRNCYAGTKALLDGPAARLGISTTWVDATRPGAISEAVESGRTMLVIAETPSNPLLDLVDLDELGSITGPFTVVDSTFATPLGQCPLERGVDLVMHSATKGIAGHNDVTMGVVAGERELIDTIWGYGVIHGATPSPFDAMLALRGLRTLDVRHERQCNSALELARRLRGHASVTAVHHPGLEDHPQFDMARGQMARFGSLLSFELGPQCGYSDIVERFELIRCATSLGGPETIMCQPSSTTHAHLSHDERSEIGITDSLIRLSVGLESVDDLWADLEIALR